VNSLPNNYSQFIPSIYISQHPLSCRQESQLTESDLSKVEIIPNYPSLPTSNYPSVTDNGLREAKIFPDYPCLMADDLPLAEALPAHPVYFFAAIDHGFVTPVRADGTSTCSTPDRMESTSSSSTSACTTPERYASSPVPFLPTEVARCSSPMSPSQVFSGQRTLSPHMSSGLSDQTKREVVSSQLAHALEPNLASNDKLSTFDEMSYFEGVVRHQKMKALVDHMRHTWGSSYEQNILQDVIKKLPKTDEHNHSSAGLSLETYRQIIVEYNLWYDPVNHTFSTSPADQKHVVCSEAFKNTKSEHYVQFEKKLEPFFNRPKGRHLTVEDQNIFHGPCFDVVCSILDCIPLTDWIGRLLLDAKEHNCIAMGYLQQQAVALPSALNKFGELYDDRDAFDKKLKQCTELPRGQFPVFVDAEDGLYDVVQDKRYIKLFKLFDRLYAFLEPHLKKSTGLKKLIEAYQKCDQEAGNYLIDKNWRSGQESDENCKPISSGDSEISVAITREIIRTDPSLVSCFWHVWCGFEIINKLNEMGNPLVRSLSFVGDESDPTAMQYFYVQGLMVRYFQDKYKYYHASQHLGEIVTGSDSQSFNNRIKEGLSLYKTDSVSHLNTIKEGKDSLGILDVICAKDIGIHTLLTSNKELLNVEFKEHLFPMFLERASATLCTDDGNIFKTNITKEKCIALNELKLKYRDAILSDRNGLSMAYLTEAYDRNKDQRPNETIRRTIYYRNEKNRLKIKRDYLKLYNPDWNAEEDPVVGEEVRTSDKIKKMIQFERALAKAEEACLKTWCDAHQKKYQRWETGLKDNFKPYLRKIYKFLPDKAFEDIFSRTGQNTQLFERHCREYLATGGKTIGL
jgi:hypothetical protein